MATLARNGCRRSNPVSSIYRNSQKKELIRTNTDMPQKLSGMEDLGTRWHILEEGGTVPIKCLKTHDNSMMDPPKPQRLAMSLVCLKSWVWRCIILMVKKGVGGHRGMARTP